MHTPNLKAPSKIISNTEKKNENNYSGTLVYVLIGIIICLTIIVFAMMLSPSPSAEKKINQEIFHKEIKIEKNTEVNHEGIKFNENIQIDWMIKKSDAENKKIQVWAKKDYEIALVLERQAESFKNKKEYNKSENHYKKAIEQIDKILNKKEQIFNQLLIDGSTYIEEDLERAKLYFIKAQAIDKENILLNRSLERIKNRNEVMSLYKQSQDKEKKYKLDEAIKILKKALLIEPEYKKINDKLMELNKKKLKIDFNNTISQILEALDKNNLTLAEKKMSFAKSLNLTDPIIGELEVRIEQEIKNYQIKRLHKIAKKQEKNEQWQEAQNSYKKILKFDSDASMAIVSQQRVNAYIYLNKLINDIILKPERLQNDQVLEKSKKTLQFIKSELEKKSDLYRSNKKLKLKTPKLAKKISLLEKIIREASMLISVTIASDNETEVTIYKVAKLGKIIEKNLKLRPGQYTIVGSRTGYRDFRKILHVSATDQTILIDVQCKEKI